MMTQEEIAEALKDLEEHEKRKKEVKERMKR